MNKIDSVIAEVESALQKLGSVKNVLEEIKGNAEAIEKARAGLKGANVGTLSHLPYNKHNR